MPGSSVNVSDANTVLDTAVAKTLKEFADAMEARGDMEFEHAALNWVRKSLQAHKRILFSGDGYSEEWHVEAERRGLCNFATTADACRASLPRRTSSCSLRWACFRPSRHAAVTR